MIRMDTSREPVLIVGAGPVGLSAALGLTRHGTPVRLIDQASAPSSHSKALVVWRRTLHGLDPLVTFSSIEPAPQPVSGVIFREAGKTLARVDFTESDHVLPAGLFIPQDRTEQILLEALASRGTTVERRKTLTRVRSGADGVVVDLEGPGGTESIRTPWLIGCDGGHSTVRRELGLDFPGETRPRRFLLADVAIEEDVEDPGAMRLELAAEGFLALFPIGPRRWRIVADEGEIDPAAPPREVTLEMVRAILRERTSVRWTLTRAHWLTEFRINERQVESYVHGRVVLAGDAAHVHSPAGGQGMNTGIQDALNVGWKIALVMAGGAPETLVNTYHAERHPVGARVLRDSHRMLAAATLPEGFLQRLRGVALPALTHFRSVRRRLVASLTEDAVTYRDGPLAGLRRPAARFGPGDAFPDVPLADSGSSSLELLRGAEATLVILGEHPDSGLETFGTGSRGFPVTRRTVRPTAAGAALRDAVGFGSDGGFILVRPDGVIAAVEDRIEEIRRWCEERLTGRGG